VSVLDDIHAARGRVSNLWLALAADEPFLRAAFDLYRAAMHAPGGLPRRDRELLCLATSWANDCAYCAAHHRRHALREGFTPEALRRVQRGEPLEEPRDEALRALAAALAADPSADLTALMDDLRGLGLGELDLQQAIQICAAYGMYNRLALGLKVPAEALPEP
jgi:uncharacterized peroxidase-related enzyme